MVNDDAILERMPGLAMVSRNPCNNCQHGHKCLEAPWIPPRLMKNWIAGWREYAKRVPALGDVPDLLAQVKYLKTIRSAKLEAFIKKNCSGHNGHCP